MRTQESPRGTQETPRRHSGYPWRDPGVTQRGPGGTQRGPGVTLRDPRDPRRANRGCCVLLSKVARLAILPQRGEGDMHDLHNLRTKVDRRTRPRTPFYRTLIPKTTRQNPYSQKLFGE